MNSDAWHPLLLFFFFSTTVCGNSRLDPAKAQQKGKIVSNAEQFSVKQGDAVTFPCHTLNKGDSVITWNWSGKLVSAGNVKVLGDDRVFVLQDGKELRIVNISEFDRGDISCSSPQNKNCTSKPYTSSSSSPSRGGARTQFPPQPHGGRSS